MDPPASLDSAGECDQVKSIPSRSFLSGPVVESSSSSVGGHGFDPWLGNKDPTCLGTSKHVRHKRKNPVSHREDSDKTKSIPNKCEMPKARDHNNECCTFLKIFQHNVKP